MQATDKGSDQTARTRRLIWDCACHTYHIVGNLMTRLKYQTATEDLMNEKYVWLNITSF